MKSEYLDLFDEYFSSTLEGQKRLEFETRLDSDEGIREAFQEYRSLRNGIDYSIMKTLKEELQQLESTLPEVTLDQGKDTMAKEVSLIERFGWWKAAAVIVVLAVSTVVVIQLNQPISNQDLFGQYFIPAENAYEHAKRGDDIAANPLVPPFQAYDNENYAEAIDGFTRILAEEDNIMVLFFLGNAQLAQNQTQEAIATFEQYLIISEESVTDAKWYLALAYLKEDRVAEARALLEGLRSEDEYGKRASSILGKLK